MKWSCVLLHTERARIQVEGQVPAQALEEEWRQRLSTKETVMLEVAKECHTNRCRTSDHSRQEYVAERRSISNSSRKPRSAQLRCDSETISEEMHAEHVLC